MKKLFLFSILVLAFAATAYSQEAKLDFRASGFFSVTENFWRWNLSNQVSGSNGIVQIIDASGGADAPPNAALTKGGEWNKTGSYVERRGRLKFDAIMGKELSGTFFFEMDSQTWGDQVSGLAPSGNGQQRNRIGYWQGDRAGIEIKNLYFDVAIPIIPIPMTARFGVQPFGLRSNVFQYTDGAGITVSAKVDPIQIVGYWEKALQGEIASSTGDEGYGLQVNAKIDTLTIGGYGFYWNINNYPLTSATPPYFSAVDSIKGDMWWLGAFADGRVGPVNINFDFVYDTGKLKNKLQDQKVDFDGWVGRLKVDYPWEAFNFGVVGVYGSGADARKTSRFGTPGELVADPSLAALGVTASKVGSYVVPIQSETGGDDSEVLFSSYIGGGFTGWGYTQDNTRLTRGTYGGLWFAKLYASYKPVPEYKITLQGLYIGDTTSHGDTFGFALKDPTNPASALKNSSEIGWEIDLINEWQIYKNLNFKFGGGWLFAGDALKEWDSIRLENKKPKDPFILISKLTYSF